MEKRTTCLIVVPVLIGMLAISACSDSSTSAGSDSDANGLGLVGVNTGSGNFLLTIDITVNDLLYCYDGEGCHRAGTITWWPIAEGEQNLINTSGVAPSARNDWHPVGVIAEYNVQEGEGRIEVWRIREYLENGVFRYEEIERVHTTGVFTAGDVIRIEYGQTDG